MVSPESCIRFLESVTQITPVPLEPVTARISFENALGESEEKRFYFEPGGFSVHTCPEPSDDFDDIVASMAAEYKRQQQQISQHLDPQAYADTLHYLTARFYSRFGSPRGSEVSVFDERRIRLATQCRVSSEDQPFLLVKGDVSGIQDFIYSVSDNLSSQVGEGTHRAKKLRGRSFYISLLTDTIADALVHRMGLQEPHVLYCGGGHFTILAPNEPSVVDALEEMRCKINTFFLNSFQLRLTLVLDYVEAPGTIADNFSEAYNLLEQKIARSKKQKALDLLDFFDRVFDRSRYREKAGAQERLFRNIGGSLPRGCLLVQVFDAAHLTSVDSATVVRFAELDIQWIILEDKGSLTALLEELDGKRKRVFTLGEPELFLDPLDSAVEAGVKDVAFGFKFFGIFAPRSGQDSGCGGVCDFETLTVMGRDSDSYPMLSVMRLDVDNLGAIFSFGLSDPDKKTSLYHVATLSRELILFFCHHVNRVAEKYSCYVTYSGGDDAFIVGSWINVIEFARELYEDFRSFSCENPSLTFSAGIVQCNSHYPILQAGYDAGTKESEAKHHDFSSDRQQASKNAVSIFDRVVHWDVLIEQLRFAERCYELFDRDSTTRSYSRSLLHRILSQLIDAIDETGAVGPLKLHVAVSRLTWVFARSPNGITNKRLVDFDHDKLSAVERLKVDFARRVIEGNGLDLVNNYSIITSYLLLRTRKRD